MAYNVDPCLKCVFYVTYVNLSLSAYESKVKNKASGSLGLSIDEIKRDVLKTVFKSSSSI